MSHPRRYDPDDPLLHRLRDICLALPQAAEKESHGRPNFFTTKVFAIFGGVIKGDHHNDRHARSVLFLPDSDERDGLLADGRFFVPAYLGPGGWLGLDLVEDPNWTEVAELVDMSYRNTATKTLIRQLDQSSS